MPIHNRNNDSGWKAAFLCLSIFGVLLLVAIAITTGFTAGRTATDPLSDGCSTNLYAAPFICGANPSATDRITPGVYATQVQIQNVHAKKSVDVTMRVALSFPPADRQPGIVTSSVTNRIEMHEVLMIDCEEILNDFEGVPPRFSPLSPPYLSGMLSIEADRSIVVVQQITSIPLPPNNGTSAVSQLQIPANCI